MRRFIVHTLLDSLYIDALITTSTARCNGVVVCVPVLIFFSCVSGLWVQFLSRALFFPLFFLLTSIVKVGRVFLMLVIVVSIIAVLCQFNVVLFAIFNSGIQFTDITEPKLVLLLSHL